MTNTNRILRLALSQQAVRDDLKDNRDATERARRRAAEADCRPVLLQELDNGGYFCQSEDAARFDLAESVPGPTTERLGLLAAEVGLVIVGSVFERRAAGLYHNTAVALAGAEQQRQLDAWLTVQRGHPIASAAL